MAPDADRLLLVRPEDHVVLGVRWTAMRLAVDAPGMLETTGPEALIAITLPPQHLGETVLEETAPFSTREARRSATSELVFRPPHPSRVPMTATGLLEALRSSTIVGERVTAVGFGTVIELPYGLTSYPAGADGEDVVGDHAAAPVISPSGAVGLWWSRVRAVSAKSADAGLVLAAVRTRAHESEPAPLPLSPATRERIAAESSHGPLPTATRLDVTSLGGSLAAQAAWETADWAYEAELGRDQRVRFLTTGVLYPLGHRAVYIESSERGIDSAPAVAALRVHRTLIVTEPVLLGVEGDDQLARYFPFDEVEITTRTFVDLGPPIEHTQKRDAIALAALRSEHEQKLADKLALLPSVEAEAVRVRSVDELGIAEVGQVADVDAQIGPLAEDIAAAQAVLDRDAALLDAISALQHQIDQIESTTPMDPDGTPSEEIRALEEEIRALQLERSGLSLPAPGALAALQQQLATLQRESTRLHGIIDVEQHRARSLDELVAARFQPAIDLVTLNQALADLEARINTLADAATHPQLVFVEPHTANGNPLLFPVRCSPSRGGPRPGDVHFELPLIFVNDLRLTDEDGLEPLFTLTDKRVLDAVAAAYTLLGDVALPGVPIDLVRAPTRADGDVHEVHALSFDGASHRGGVRPRLQSLVVALPALRTLLPDAQNGFHRVKFDEAYLERGASEDVLFAIVSDEIKINFQSDADRSGGLVSPTIKADAISRQFGPVAAGGLVADASGVLDPMKVLGDGATILGFDLRTLIKDLRVPPTIVSTLAAGELPDVRMSWTGVALQDAGPFVAHGPAGPATLDLTVEHSGTNTTTTCSIKQFALELPPGPLAFLRVHFGSVEFKQGSGSPMHLAVHDVSADFLGDLRLLDDLRALVKTGDGGPTVKATSERITAGYAFAVPTIATGAFALSNIAVDLGIDVPFAPTPEEPISVSIGFSSRRSPFALSVFPFSGGGYVDLKLDRTGLRRCEISFEFGAAIAINLVVAAAEVHALGGVRAVVDGDDVTITAFVRIGGSVELLGLVSVSVELLVELRYDPPPLNRLAGRASLVIEVDLTLYSDSVRIDSGEFILAGAGSISPFDELEAADDDEAALATWQAYRAAFAAEPVR